MDLKKQQAGLTALTNVHFKELNMLFLNCIFIFIGFVQVAKGGNSIVGIDSKGTDCVIPIGSKQDYLAKWPLAYKANGELYSTVTDNESSELKILVKAGDEVLLSCGPNYLKPLNRKEVINVQCNGATGNFTNNQVNMPARDLTCDLRVIEEVMGSVPGCVETTSRFGYVDPIKKTTVLLGEACYDMNSGATKFVHFKLGDTTSNYLEEQPKSYLTTLRHPDGRYKIELFRGLQFDDIYERIRTKLHTKQIPQLKIAHYIDNALLSNPQFQAVKKLGWNYFVGYDDNETLENLKEDIKRLSETKNLDIYTGSHGVKQLHGNDGSKIDIYLHQASKRFPMPDLVWFIVKSEDKAIAFGVLNDDNSNRLEENEKETQNTNRICKNTSCEQISWLSANLKHDNKLICCDVNDFQQTVQEAPVIGSVNNMLI